MVKAAALIAGAFIMVAAPAVAQTSPGETAVAKDVTSEQDPDRIICRKEEQIGSRLGAKKLCMTVREWDERAQVNREHTEKVQQQSGVRSGS